MKRFTWWRMEQNAPHNARERWCASCSILHHVKRFMSQPPQSCGCFIEKNRKQVFSGHCLGSTLTLRLARPTLRLNIEMNEITVKRLVDILSCLQNRNRNR